MEAPNSADASVNVQLELVTVYMQPVQRVKRRFTHPLILGQWVVDHQILVAFGLARVGDVL